MNTEVAISPSDKNISPKNIKKHNPILVTLFGALVLLNIGGVLYNNKLLKEVTPYQNFIVKDSIEDMNNKTNLSIPESFSNLVDIYYTKSVLDNILNYSVTSYTASNYLHNTINSNPSEQVNKDSLKQLEHLIISPFTKDDITYLRAQLDQVTKISQNINKLPFKAKMIQLKDEQLKTIILSYKKSLVSAVALINNDKSVEVVNFYKKHKLDKNFQKDLFSLSQQELWDKYFSHLGNEISLALSVLDTSIQSMDERTINSYFDQMTKETQ